MNGRTRVRERMEKCRDLQQTKPILKMRLIYNVIPKQSSRRESAIHYRAGRKLPQRPTETFLPVMPRERGRTSLRHFTSTRPNPAESLSDTGLDGPDASDRTWPFALGQPLLHGFRQSKEREKLRSETIVLRERLKHCGYLARGKTYPT